MIRSKPFFTNKDKSTLFIKTMRSGVCCEWIYKQCTHVRISKTVLYSSLHHLCPISFSQICFFTDPYIQSTHIFCGRSPILRRFDPRVNDLQKAYRTITVITNILPHTRNVFSQFIFSFSIALRV